MEVINLIVNLDVAALKHDKAIDEFRKVSNYWRKPCSRQVCHEFKEW